MTERTISESTSPRRKRGMRRTVVPLPRGTRSRVSHAQRRLWFVDQAQGTSTEYSRPGALRLRGVLDVEALQRAVRTIVDRHESLRTTFAEEQGEPVQVIAATSPIEVTVEDVQGWPEAAQTAHLRAAVRAEVETPFDLAQGPLLRMRLRGLGATDHVLLRTIHHIVSDAWSEGNFNRELLALYDAFHAGRDNPLPPLAVQYADFAVWQRDWLAQGALAQGLAYWTAQLAEIPERLTLPTDRPRPPVQTFAADVCYFTVSAEQVTALKHLSQAHEATLYMTLLAAYGVLLARYSGQDDIVVGSPIANRQDAQLEPLIGFFVNTLVMRLRLRPGLSFATLLADVRRTALEAYQHQDVPFERVVKALAPHRTLNRNPLFQVSFTMLNAPLTRLTLPGLQVQGLVEEELKVRFDLELHAWERDGRFTVSWVYNRDLFDRWRIEQMARHDGRILEAGRVDDTGRVDDIDLLDATEQQRIVSDWTPHPALLPPTTLPALFEAQVVRTPDATALVCTDQHVTYATLNARANQLAHLLIRHGAGPEKIVGLAVPRSLDMVVALLGITKTGAAYLPLDLESPISRLTLMLRNVSALGVVAGGDALKTLSVTDAVSVIIGVPLVGEGEISNPLVFDRCSVIREQNLAYVIYTSGSTGKPKAVGVSHRALTNYLAWGSRLYASTDGAGAPLNTPLAFDATVTSVYLPLLWGQRVTIVPEANQLERLAELLKHGPDFTLVKLTPSHLLGLAGLLGQGAADGRPRRR